MSNKSNKSEQEHPIPPTWWPEGNTMLDLSIALGSPERDPFTQVSSLHPINSKLEAIKEWPTIRKHACELFGHQRFEGETWDRLVEWLQEKHGKQWDGASHGKPKDDTLATELGQVLDWLIEAEQQDKGASAGSGQCGAGDPKGTPERVIGGGSPKPTRRPTKPHC